MIADIDAYIAAQDPAIRPMLQSLRETIREAAPDCEECIAWEMPSFRQGEYLIHFAAFRSYAGIFPGKDALLAFEERLKGYVTTKALIRLPYTEPVDHGLIRDILKWRLSLPSRGTSRSPSRALVPMPAAMKKALEESGLAEAFSLRPPYQQNSYTEWIVRAKREETKERRMHQLLEELAQHRFMKRPHPLKSKK